MKIYYDCSACVDPVTFGVAGVAFFIPAALFAYIAGYVLWNAWRDRSSGPTGNGGAE